MFNLQEKTQQLSGNWLDLIFYCAKRPLHGRSRIFWTIDKAYRPLVSIPSPHRSLAYDERIPYCGCLTQRARERSLRPMRSWWKLRLLNTSKTKALLALMLHFARLRNRCCSFWLPIRSNKAAVPVRIAEVNGSTEIWSTKILHNYRMMHKICFVQSPAKNSMRVLVQACVKVIDGHTFQTWWLARLNGFRLCFLAWIGWTLALLCVVAVAYVEFEYCS